jgi:hypothetical protein
MGIFIGFQVAIVGNVRKISLTYPREKPEIVQPLGEWFLQVRGKPEALNFLNHEIFDLFCNTGRELEIFLDPGEQICDCFPQALIALYTASEGTQGQAEILKEGERLLAHFTG